MPKMLFPKPFAQAPKPERAAFRRQSPTELRTLSRAERLERMVQQDQAEMWKEAERGPGEWVAMGPGVALFLPAAMLRTARAMTAVDVGALARAS